MSVKWVRPVEMLVRPFQEVAKLGEQIDAYCDLSTPLALDDLQPTGNRR